jgi:transposase
VKGLTRPLPQIEQMIASLLAARDVIMQQLNHLDQAVLRIAYADEACARRMTAPGVGLIVALTYRTSMDVPDRFESREVSEPTSA